MGRSWFQHSLSEIEAENTHIDIISLSDFRMSLLNQAVHKTRLRGMKTLRVVILLFNISMIFSFFPNIVSRMNNFLPLGASPAYIATFSSSLKS